VRECDGGGFRGSVREGKTESCQHAQIVVCLGATIHILLVGMVLQRCCKSTRETREKPPRDTPWAVRHSGVGQTAPFPELSLLHFRSSSLCSFLAFTAAWLFTAPFTWWV
jgi:hypothetical protein